MEELLKNPAFLAFMGVLIGGIVTQLGTFFNQLTIAKKEKIQWNQKRIAEKEDKHELITEEKKSYTTDLYHKCVLSLSLYISHQNQNEESPPQDIINDIHHWLSLLSLKHSDRGFLYSVDSFLHRPDKIIAGGLREKVQKFAKNENLLFAVEQPDTPKKEDINSKKFQFCIDQNFRKEKMVEGIELPKEINITYELEKISEGHRKRLLDIYFPSYQCIPKNISLLVPIHYSGQSKIQLRGKPWEAKINPSKYNEKQILDMWVKDYDEELAKANDSLESEKKQESK